MELSTNVGYDACIVYSTRHSARRRPGGEKGWNRLVGIIPLVGESTRGGGFAIGTILTYPVLLLIGVDWLCRRAFTWGLIIMRIN